MKKPIDWREFISKDENEMELIEIMLKVWCKDSFVTHLQSRNITMIVNGTTYQLTFNDGINTIMRKNTTISSSQEETDTRIIIYC